ncbi:hypothetical protein [Enterococcus florum]|uniref:hypothetical protein n=1 Tax=Enterococcus florum TaxID=2480627 RepID=UPI0011BA9F77|nr:hypothetical protein [Enterococcus florum]
MKSNKQQSQPIRFLPYALSFVLVKLSFDWGLDLFWTGWSLKTALNFPIVYLFLLFSYLLEAKTALHLQVRLLLYTTYFFIVGSCMSMLIYQNAVSLSLILVYLLLAFLGALAWSLICFYLKK